MKTRTPNPTAMNTELWKKPRIPRTAHICSERPVIEEGQAWAGYVLTRNITPNPEQPRKDFEGEKMVLLSNSLHQRGQQVAAPVRIINDPERPHIWFQLIDSERRWRICDAFDAPLRVEYNPDGPKTQQETNIASFVANFARADLTHSEIIAYVWKMLHEYKMTREEIADSVGQDVVWVGKYIHLHHLHPELIELLDHPSAKQRLATTKAEEISKAPPEKQLVIYHKLREVRGKYAKAVTRQLVGQDAVRGNFGQQNEPKRKLGKINTALDNAAGDIAFLTSMDFENIDPKDRWVLAKKLKALTLMVAGFHDKVVPDRKTRDALRAEGFDPEKAMQTTARKVASIESATKVAKGIFGENGERSLHEDNDSTVIMRPWNWNGGSVTGGA